jgi:hypothetical protein
MLQKHDPKATAATLAKRSREVNAPVVLDDIFGIEDLLDQAYEDAVWLRLTPAYQR